MQIAIGTKNRAKVAAVQSVTAAHIDQPNYITVDVASGVSNQPISNEETRQGAINRAQTAVNETGATIAFGLEGGVYEIDGTMYCCNWGALATNNGELYTCAGATFVLPEVIAEQLRLGKELGPVMDAFTNTENIRHHAGAIGIFTNGFVDRQQMFEHIVTLLIGQYTCAHI